MWLINPLSQLGRSQKIDMRFSRKDLWERPLSTGVNLHDIYRKPTRFLRMLYQGKQHQLELKWTTTTKRTKKAFWSAKLSREETGWYYCSAAYIWYHFIKKKKKKKNNSGGRTARQEGGTSNSDCRAGRWTHCFQNLKPDSVCLAGFWNYLGSVTQFLFSSLPFWDEVSITTIDSPTTVFWEQIIF